MKKAVIFLGEGFEEIEALTVVDVLRRGGIHIDMVSVSNTDTVSGSHDIEVVCDKKIDEITPENYDICILPGGNPGYKNLQASQAVKDISTSFLGSGKLVCAICAAPTVLGAFGLLKGKEACCYPGMEDGLDGAKVSFEDVVVDNNVITSRGMGTAIEFSLAIIEYCFDKDTADKLGASFVWKRI